MNKTSYRIVALTFALSLLLVLDGCAREPSSPAGFRLPDGDVHAGRETFLYMHCHQCHTVSGDEFPTVAGEEPPYVQLGGPVARVKTYGELVTAIINPSHKLAPGYAEDVVSEDGESKMPVYNEFMTVQELTDLTAYLQGRYEVVVPAYTYRIYPY